MSEFDFEVTELNGSRKMQYKCNDTDTISTLKDKISLEMKRSKEDLNLIFESAKLDDTTKLSELSKKKACLLLKKEIVKKSHAGKIMMALGALAIIGIAIFVKRRK